MNASHRLKLWRKDPVQFVKDNFQVDPDLWQEDALNAFASRDDDKWRVAMRACAGISLCAMQRKGSILKASQYP